mmetsp:Transcript_11650/g.35563  ORF Transcript_11650/g.35563 Transcript_11650/m.35563 type:complete len:150 (-) Transcript_11650:1731-2180(-)
MELCAKKGSLMWLSSVEVDTSTKCGSSDLRHAHVYQYTTTPRACLLRELQGGMERPPSIPPATSKQVSASVVISCWVLHKDMSENSRSPPAVADTQETAQRSVCGSKRCRSTCCSGGQVVGAGGVSWCTMCQLSSTGSSRSSRQAVGSR